MVEKYCDCCGRYYVESRASIYRLKYKGKTKAFCSYTCYVKLQKLKEDKKYEEIDKIFNEVQQLKTKDNI